MNTHSTRMNVTPDQLVEVKKQIVLMCHKLEASLQSLRSKAAEGRRLKPQITLAERRLQALHIALRCLNDAIATELVWMRQPTEPSREKHVEGE